MRAIFGRGLLGLILAGSVVATARGDEAAPPAQPTPGDRVEASGTVTGLKRFSERLGSGVGGALDRAGAATGRAGAAVGGAFEAADDRMSGWMGRMGFKPLSDEERAARAAKKARRRD